MRKESKGEDGLKACFPIAELQNFPGPLRSMCTVGQRDHVSQHRCSHSCPAAPRTERQSQEMTPVLLA
jgi:hypothetical protein